MISLEMDHQDLPPPEHILEMEPEDLAPFVLRYLQKQPRDQISRYNYTLRNDQKIAQLLGKRYDDYTRKLMEAWIWLEHERLLAPTPGSQGDWYYVTSRGMSVDITTDFESFKQRALFPRHFDPVFIKEVRPLFLRGDYGTAVFRAFKEVEVRVRTLGGFSSSDIGVELMQKAFGPTGPLTDEAAPVAEQNRMRELFVGAIGTFKNPSSHRDVDFDDPTEVIDVISFANQLLRIAGRD